MVGVLAATSLEKCHTFYAVIVAEWWRFSVLTSLSAYLVRRCRPHVFVNWPGPGNQQIDHSDLPIINRDIICRALH